MPSIRFQIFAIFNRDETIMETYKVIAKRATHNILNYNIGAMESEKNEKRERETAVTACFLSLFILSDLY